MSKNVKKVSEFKTQIPQTRINLQGFSKNKFSNF